VGTGASLSVYLTNPTVDHERRRAWTEIARERSRRANGGPRLSKARLDELVEEALVDAYGESEQAAGFYTMIENDLRLPFQGIPGL
jgi:hypothetical protein